MHFHFEVPVQGECDRDHMAVVTSALAKSFVFAVHTKTLNWRFQIYPLWKAIFQIYPDYCGRDLSCEDEN